jgi:glycosyltransferase involved in cell wall biosynthesis
MRLAVLTDSLADTDGVGRYTIRLLQAMEARDPNLRVEVALARKHPGISSAVPARWPVRVALPPDYFFHMSRPRFLAYLTASVARVLPMALRADLVHSIKDYPHCYVGWLAARLAGKPCVMTAHGTYSVVPLTDPRHARRARAAFPRFGKILCVSEYTRRRMSELLPLKNLEVVKNAVDAAHYAPRARMVGKPWSGARYTLGIGALKERKGHHLSIAAFLRVAREFPDLRHFIIGAHESGDPYFEGIRASIREAGCEERVVFLGNVSEDEKVDLLQGALALLHTPVVAADGGFEGFGIVYLEAAASGVPSIATLGSGAEDAVVDGRTGFLVRADAGSVEAALLTLLRDPARRAALAAGASAYAREQTWDRNAERVLAIYRELTGDRASR